MCYYTVAYSIYIVVGIEVYHIARCGDLNDSNDCIYNAVPEHRLCWYQLKRQQCTLMCLNIPEQRICTNTGQQKCHGSAQQLVVQVHKPDITITVHAHVIYLLGVGIQVLGHKQRICGQDTGGYFMCLSQGAHIRLYPRKHVRIFYMRTRCTFIHSEVCRYYTQLIQCALYVIALFLRELDTVSCVCLVHSALDSTEQHCNVSGNGDTVDICVLYWSTDEQLSGHAHSGLNRGSLYELKLVMLIQGYPLMLGAGNQNTS